MGRCRERHHNFHVRVSALEYAAPWHFCITDAVIWNCDFSYHDIFWSTYDLPTSADFRNYNRTYDVKPEDEASICKRRKWQQYMFEVTFITYVLAWHSIQWIINLRWRVIRYSYFLSLHVVQKSYSDARDSPYIYIYIYIYIYLQFMSEWGNAFSYW